MAYVKSPATAARGNSSYAKPAAPAASAPKAEGASQPTHTLSIKCGEGDNVEFINLTGLFPGETKDGRSMMKGKPRATVIIRTEDGRELVGTQFFVNSKN